MSSSMFVDLLEGKKYNTDLLITILWSILATIGAFLPDGNIFRIILAIPLIIFLPGYAFVSVLWPEMNNKKGDEEVSEGSNDAEYKSTRIGIDNLERVALSFGLSMVIVSLIGLALNYTPLGITLTSTLFGNLVAILVLVVFAYYRRSVIPQDRKFHLNFLLKAPAMPKERTERFLVIIIIFSVIISCLMFTYVLTTPSIGNKYSEFYILDINGTTENYPTNFTTNETVTMIVGIISHEHQTTDYSIIVGIENTTNTNQQNDWNNNFTLDSTTSIRKDLTLNHEDEYKSRFSFNINEPGRYKVVWSLYIDGSTESNYEVYLWIDVLD